VPNARYRDRRARWRRHRLALTLAHQYPSQLSEGLRDEIFGQRRLARRVRTEREGCTGGPEGPS
jgi:hypothetical protein